MEHVKLVTVKSAADKQYLLNLLALVRCPESITSQADGSSQADRVVYLQVGTKKVILFIFNRFLKFTSKELMPYRK